MAGVLSSPLICCAAAGVCFAMGVLRNRPGCMRVCAPGACRPLGGRGIEVILTDGPVPMVPRSDSIFWAFGFGGGPMRLSGSTNSPDRLPGNAVMPPYLPIPGKAAAKPNGRTPNGAGCPTRPASKPVEKATLRPAAAELRGGNAAGRHYPVRRRGGALDQSESPRRSGLRRWRFGRHRPEERDG